MRTFLTITLFFLGIGTAMAQGAPSWLEDSLHGNGKINTVIAVVAVIILGIGLWMWAQDRRIGRMEKTMNKE
jgi:type IV secretory pathway VirB2 component (pilin)